MPRGGRWLVQPYPVVKWPPARCTMTRPAGSLFSFRGLCVFCPWLTYLIWEASELFASPCQIGESSHPC